jgi:histidine triad (HIT) family protein
MEDSIFTKIIKGEIPSHRIYEDETTYAFLDVHPAIEGYTLVIPKRQVDHIWDLPDDEYVALMRSVKKVAEKQRATLGKARVGVKIEGLEVPHAHVKVFAFSTAEEFNAPAHDSDDEALAAVAERLRIDD